MWEGILLGWLWGRVVFSTPAVEVRTKDVVGSCNLRGTRGGFVMAFCLIEVSALCVLRGCLRGRVVFLGSGNIWDRNRAKCGS
jgi:hypothetical protein